METNWTAAGARNCAAVRPDTRSMLLCDDDVYASRYGASRGGMLNEANIVRQSRRAKTAKHGRGTGRGAAAPGARKSLTKAWSLYTHSDTLAREEAANLAGPEVVVRAGEADKVDVAVSRALAVM